MHGEVGDFRDTADFGAARDKSNAEGSFKNCETLHNEVAQGFDAARGGWVNPWDFRAPLRIDPGRIVSKV